MANENEVWFRVSECARFVLSLRANELPRKVAFQSTRNFSRSTLAPVSNDQNLILDRSTATYSFSFVLLNVIFATTIDDIKIVESANSFQIFYPTSYHPFDSFTSIERKCQCISFIRWDKYGVGNVGRWFKALPRSRTPGCGCCGGARRKNRPNVHASRCWGYSATVLHHVRSSMLSDREGRPGTSLCFAE